VTRPIRGIRLPTDRLIMFLFLLACSATSSAPGDSWDVVDLHLHPGDWHDIPDSTQSFLASRFPYPFGLQPEVLANAVLSGDAILGELDDAGVSRGVLLSVYAPRTVGVASNERVLEALAADPSRLMGMASLSTDDWTHQAQAQLQALDAALAEPGMVGIKLAGAHQHFRLDDPAYFDIYDVAVAHGVPVYHHTGPSPFPGTRTEPPYTDPAYLESAVAAYPQIAFVLGHVGYDFLDRHLDQGFDAALDLASRYDNVFLEPSALGSRHGDPDGTILSEVFLRVREAGLADRVIYGSDGPQSPGFVADYLSRTLAAMEGWSDDEIAAALGGTFSQVYER